MTGFGQAPAWRARPRAASIPACAARGVGLFSSASCSSSASVTAGPWADPGDWHLHCHLPHHMMNQMTSMVGPIMMSHANTPRPGPPAPNTGMFPGYPQDMVMVMDEMVAKPETYGLRPGWSGGTMGMMTIIRVLKPELFERIEQLKAEQARKAAEQ